MRHRVYTILAVLSLLLFVAVGVLWVRSDWVLDQYVFGRDAGLIGVTSVRWQVHLVRHTYGPGSPMSGDTFHQGYRGLPVKPALRPAAKRSMLGFAYTSDYDGPLRMTSQVLAVPHWALLVALAVLPVLRVTLLSERRRRRRLGLCAACGYDLRATPDRCPECGTMAPAQPRQ